MLGPIFKHSNSRPGLRDLGCPLLTGHTLARSVPQRKPHHTAASIPVFRTVWWSRAWIHRGQLRANPQHSSLSAKAASANYRASSPMFLQWGLNERSCGTQHSARHNDKKRLINARCYHSPALTRCQTAVGYIKNVRKINLINSVFIMSPLVWIRRLNLF